MRWWRRSRRAAPPLVRVMTHSGEVISFYTWDAYIAWRDRQS